MDTGEVTYEKVFASLRLLPKISVKHDWKRELDSADAQRPDGQVLQRLKNSQSNQPVPNPDHDRRTEQPVVSCYTNVRDSSQTRSSHESISFNVGDETIHDRTGQPVVNRDESGHDQTMLSELNMDFRIFGFPHVVKQSESFRVRELVKKIESHPDLHGFQLDLQQHKAYNPFSTTFKKMIQDVGNFELLESIARDGP